jgi:uncharacterized protein YerC
LSLNFDVSKHHILLPLEFATLARDYDSPKYNSVYKLRYFGYSVFMAQVSRRMLKPGVWNRVFNLFLATFSNVKSKEELRIFIEDLLSPTEKTMLAKRFAIAILLAKGNSYDSIMDTVKVTSGTVSKVKILLRYGKGLNKAIEKALKKDRIRIFWEEMQDLMDSPTKGNLKGFRIRSRKRIKKIEELKKGIA